MDSNAALQASKPEQEIESECVNEEINSTKASKHKKRKSKKKPEHAVVPAEPTSTGAADTMVNALIPNLQGVDASSILQAIERLTLQKKNSKRSGVPKEHKFWNTQPVVQLHQEPTDYGPLEVKTVDEIRKEPYAMPAGFIWAPVDVSDDAQILEVYTLLTENYVEDDDNMFRFDYSVPFLRWALTPPNFNPDLHVGVRNAKNGKLMGFITGIPVKMRVYEEIVEMVEINFLCVHKKLRSKRLAPVLIKEVTRRVNLTGVFQAVYTAGVLLPKPFAECRYWHRSLDPKKLIEIGFSRLKPKTTLTRTIKDYRLPPDPLSPGFREMVESDVPQVQRLLENYLPISKIYPMLDVVEAGHWLLPTEGVVNSYVIQKVGSDEITDFCSFYHLPSTVIGNDKHNRLNAAYSFYNVVTSVEWVDLMRDALIMAKKMGMDVFNALDVMENSRFLEELKFGIGDGHLRYYLYNWQCPKVEAKDVGLVLL